jgi:hypothetical protein
MTLNGKHPRTALAALLVALLVTGSGLVATADEPAALGSLVPRGAATSLGVQGTAWVAEHRNQFSLLRPYGWGTEARVKASGVGYQWVHIPIPTLSIFNGTLAGVSQVMFCAQSSNGAQTRPVQIDVWNGTQRIYSSAISWWADNSYHCWTVNLTPTFAASVGISVRLYFANTTDKITLGGAAAAF